MADNSTELLLKRQRVDAQEGKIGTVHSSAGKTGVKISSSASSSLTSEKLKSPLLNFFASGEVLDSPEEEHSFLFFSRILFNKFSINYPCKK